MNQFRYTHLTVKSVPFHHYMLIFICNLLATIVLSLHAVS